MISDVRRGIAACAAALAAFGLQALVPAAAQAQTEWKMHIVFIESRDETATYRRWAQNITERSKGKLKITVFPGGSLGVKDVDMLRVLPQGNVIQAAGLYPGYVSRDIPEFAYALPTGIVKDADDMIKLLPTIRDIYKSSLEKWGIKYLGMLVPQNRTYHVFCKEPIRTLAALKGKKLRVFEKSLVDAFSELGVAAQIIPQYEMYVALQTGVVDCAIYATGYATTISLQEVTPYTSFITPYASPPLTFIVSKAAFDALPPDVQAIVEEETRKIEAEEIERFRKGDWDNAELVKLNMRGATLLPPYPQADRDAFTAAARAAWRKLSEGRPASQQNYEAMTKALGAN